MSGDARGPTVMDPESLHPGVSPVAPGPEVPEVPLTGDRASRPGLLSPGGVATVARWVFLVGAALTLAYVARPVIVPMALAWVASMALKPPVRWLRRLRVPTPLAAALVVSGCLVATVLGATYLGRPAVAWLTSAPDQLPALREKFRHLLRPAARLSEAASKVGNLGAEESATRVQAVEVKDGRVASTVFTWTGGVLVAAGEAFALTFLLLASGDLFLLKFIRAIPRLAARKRMVEISREIHGSISTYLFSVGLINAIFGVVVGLSLHLLGMPNAAMWGGVAALCNFVPYVGPIVGVTAVALGGLMAFDTLQAGLLPAGLYAGLHLIESNAITPMVLGRRFALNPVVVFVALVFFTWLWGPIGALLSGPLLMTLKVVSERSPGLEGLADFLSVNTGTETSDTEAGVPRSAGVQDVVMHSEARDSR